MRARIAWNSMFFCAAPRWHRPIIFALACVVGSTVAQEPRVLLAQDVVRTPALATRSPGRYRSIVDVRELRNGDVLVSDADARDVWRVPVEGERKSAITKGEIGMPGLLRKQVGDSTLVYDRQATKFTLLLPDGRVEAAPASVQPPPGPMRIGVSLDLYFADAIGQLYWLTPSREATSPIMSRDVSGKERTIGTLKNAETRTVREGPITFTMSVPFAPLDDWAVAEDGAIAIARGDPYRVERLTGGRTISGAAREVERIAITEEDKAEHKRLRAKNTNSVNLGGAAMPTVPEAVFPATKAVFVRGAVRAAPDGSVWVHRAMPASANFTLVDVFGADAQYRETISLPRAARVVGFGTQVVYIAVPIRGGEELTLHSMPR